MSYDDPFCEHDDKTKAEPSWVTMTLWLLPVPIFAFLAMATVSAVSIFCFLIASVEQSPIGSALGSGFAVLAALIGAASVCRYRHRRRLAASELPRYGNSEQRPTGAIVVLLISIYSWMLMIGIHVFDRFFAMNRPGGLKYDVTVGVALASSIYSSVYGRPLIRKWFGARSGGNITITPGQALIVVLLTVGCGAYFAWIMD